MMFRIFGIIWDFAGWEKLWWFGINCEEGNKKKKLNHRGAEEKRKRKDKKANTEDTERTEEEFQLRSPWGPFSVASVFSVVKHLLMLIDLPH